MDLSLIGQLAAYGFVLGAFYGLIAVGLTLVFGVLHVLNAAHGTFYVVGGYATYFSAVSLGVPYWVSLLFALAAGALMGLVCEKVAVSRLRHEPMSVMVATFTLAVLVENIITVIVGNSPLEVPSPLNEHFASIAGIFLSYQRMLILAVSFITFWLIHLFLKHSRLGLAMRAVAVDMPTAALMGINVRAVYAATFALSAALAGVAGGFLTPIFSIEPTGWVFVLLKGFIVVTLGGMGSIYGAMLGGLILGIAESFGAAVLSGFKDGIGLAVLILLLLYRPQGLFGKAH